MFCFLKNRPDEGCRLASQRNPSLGRNQFSNIVNHNKESYRKVNSTELEEYVGHVLTPSYTNILADFRQWRLRSILCGTNATVAVSGIYPASSTGCIFSFYHPNDQKVGVFNTRG